ncbi:hypothetical protein OAQ62_01005 [bacterium]|nr:hypothetical protein [bacterium]
MAEVYNKNATSVLDIYKPAKVLQLSVTSATGEKYWPHDDGEGDPWWTSSSSPKFYQYKLVMTVTEYSHGSHKTREHKKYNGLDITVGDWIAGSQDGRCMQIISISSKSATSVTCIVEDVLRYNTFRSSTGSPIFSVPGTALLFTLNENGKPIIDPLPASVVSTDFYPNVTSRFEYFNPAENYRLEKTAHGFARGDVIVVTESGTYQKANASTMSRTIGVVSVVGPGPNQFAVMPQNRIIDFNPALPGTAGSYIYADTDGDLTTTDTGKVIFLKIKDSLPSNVTSSNSSITATAGDVIEINNVNVTLTGGNASTVISDINNATTTLVTASSLPEPTTVQSDTGTYNYGLLGGYIPFSANITTGSGTYLINVTTAPSGNAQYGAGIANGTDIKSTIDALSIPNFSVSVLGSGELKLSEASGNAVTITNVTNDTGGTPFAGASSVSGLPASTSATTGSYLHLTRADGGPIDIEDTTGTPTQDFSIYSAHNGQYPLGLYIEHGVRSGGITIVANISARDGLTSQGGDMAYVTDAGDGEWALFVYTGSAWSEVGNQDSAATDAQTITLDFTAPGSGFGGVETQDLANISPGARIIDIGIDVTTGLSNWTGASAPTVEVGTASDLDQFLTGDESDLETAGDYTANPNYLYPASQNNDLSLKARIYHRGATAGAFSIRVTYV